MVLTMSEQHSYLQYFAPSKAATALSRQFLVGFPLRLYSNPWEQHGYKKFSATLNYHLQKFSEAIYVDSQRDTSELVKPE